MPISRTIVVTGASRGLGLEWVRQLSEDPQNLVLAVVRNPKQAKLSSISGHQNVAIIKGDLSCSDSFQTVASDIERIGGGKVDLLINNAGLALGAETPVSKSTPKEWSEQFNVNVIGLVFFTIALIPLLEKSAEKKVINITSMLGDAEYTLANPDLQFASYSVTKASVTMVNAKFHAEFKERGFIFLALNPGWVNTELGGVHAPLQPDESIRQCLSFALRSKPRDSGRFFSLDGRPEAVTN